MENYSVQKFNFLVNKKWTKIKNYSDLYSFFIFLQVIPKIVVGSNTLIFSSRILYIAFDNF